MQTGCYARDPSRYLRDQDFLGSRSMCLFSLYPNSQDSPDKIEFRLRFILLGDKREVTVFSDQLEKKVFVEDER